MGKMQTKVGICLMLQQYKYELEESMKKNEMRYDPDFLLLSPLGGIRLRILRR